MTPFVVYLKYFLIKQLPTDYDCHQLINNFVFKIVSPPPIDIIKNKNLYYTFIYQDLIYMKTHTYYTCNSTNKIVSYVYEKPWFFRLKYNYNYVIYLVELCLDRSYQYEIY